MLPCGTRVTADGRAGAAEAATAAAAETEVMAPGRKNRHARVAQHGAS